jgi:hypothetical protein
LDSAANYQTNEQAGISMMVLILVVWFIACNDIIEIAKGIFTIPESSILDAG